MSDALARLTGRPPAASWLARLLRAANDNHAPDPPPARAMRQSLHRVPRRSPAADVGTGRRIAVA